MIMHANDALSMVQGESRRQLEEIKQLKAEIERLLAASIPFPLSGGCPQCYMLVPHTHGGDPNN